MSIKYLFIDVDGTLTDGKIYMGQEGELMKAFDIKDGCAIHDILPNIGITPVVVTARESKIVARRCLELGITELYQGCRDKAATIMDIAKAHGLTIENGVVEEFAYIGDDIIDIPGMKICKIKGCPADAVKEVVDIVDFKSKFSGGSGAVREFVEWIRDT